MDGIRSSFHFSHPCPNGGIKEPKWASSLRMIGGMWSAEVGWACCPSRTMRDSTRADNMSTLRKLIPCHSSLTSETPVRRHGLAPVLSSPARDLCVTWPELAETGQSLSPNYLNILDGHSFLKVDNLPPPAIALVGWRILGSIPIQLLNALSLDCLWIAARNLSRPVCPRWTGRMGMFL